MEIIPTKKFDEDVRFYLKKKKYYYILDDLKQDVFDYLIEGKLIGDEISGLELIDEEHIYKVRAANTSANVGKSNGFRLIYLYSESLSKIYLLTVYSKKDQADISNDEIKRIVNLYYNS